MNDRVYKLTTMIAERVSALQSDGYLLVVKYVHSRGGFWKLRHRTNRNLITLNVSFEHDSMTQTSNGRVVYSGPIQP